MKNKIAVIGAGAWGCGIASVLAKNSHQIALFTNDQDVTKSINEQHISPFLPEIKLSDKIIAESFFDQNEIIKLTDFIFIIVPSKAVLEVLKKIAAQKISAETIIIICSKGIEEKSGRLFSQIIEEVLPNNDYAILSGPNFAGEVAKQLPSTTSIASKKTEVVEQIIKLLKNNYFFPVENNDVITTQLVGAMKNIFAIGCGILDGLDRGENSKATLIIKGINEIILLSEKMGGSRETLLSPAGFGDIFLTCSSKKSRNNSLGFVIGQGKKAQEILGDKNKVYEGANAAKSVLELAKKYQVHLPLCESIYKILYENGDIDLDI